MVLEFVALPRGLLNPSIICDPGKLVCIQANCVARKVHKGSLNEKLVTELGFGDPYSKRRGQRRNLAYIVDQPRMGSVLIQNPPSARKESCCSIGFLFAQYNMGDGSRLYYSSDVAYTTRCRELDKKSDRLSAFKKCLSELPFDMYSAICFPMYIGCSAAGGDWREYLDVLKECSRFRLFFIVSQI